jgi:hypothetical protein
LLRGPSTRDWQCAQEFAANGRNNHMLAIDSTGMCAIARMAQW